MVTEAQPEFASPPLSSRRSTLDSKEEDRGKGGFFHTRDEEEHSFAEPSALQDGFRRETFYVEADQHGTQIFVRAYHPLHDSKRDSEQPQVKKPLPMLLLHDVGESSFFYTKFLESCAQRGVAAYGCDLRGHGQSGNVVGHMDAMAQLCRDVLQVCAWVRYNEQQNPIVVGQGFGALIGIYFIEKNSRFCEGLVLTSPLLKLTRRVSKFERMVIERLADVLPAIKPALPVQKKLWPQYNQSGQRGHSGVAVVVGSGLPEAGELEDIPKASRRNQGRPQGVGRLSAQSLRMVLRAMDELPQVLGRIQRPLYAFLPQRSLYRDYVALAHVFKNDRKRGESVIETVVADDGVSDDMLSDYSGMQDVMIEKIFTLLEVFHRRDEGPSKT